MNNPFRQLPIIPKVFLLISALVLGIGTIMVLSIYVKIPTLVSGDLSYNKIKSIRILDRNGVLLREIRSSEWGVSRTVTLKEVPSFFIKAMLTAEDRNFYRHKGVDWPAMLRACWQSMVHGKIYSGASTISQQTVRVVYRLGSGWRQKIQKIKLALQLEKKFDKDTILEQYLNRIPFGNGQYGLDAACWYYFNKPPSSLTPGESLLMACVPQSPEIYDPLGKKDFLQKKMRRLAAKMLKNGMITEREYDSVVSGSPNIMRNIPGFKAPHFCEAVISDLKSKGIWNKVETVKTTLDYSLYASALESMRKRMEPLKKKNAVNSALLVIDNRTGDILVMVGSLNWSNPSIDGMFNCVFGLRQPGSTLKPFTYALALEQGMKASDVIPDIEKRFTSAEEAYVPRNYDNKYHGPVLFRQALACSLNIPALWVLNSIGVSSLLTMLRAAGCSSLSGTAARYGLGLTLGSGAVTLMELTRAYTAFALEGSVRKTRLVSEVTFQDGSVQTFPSGQIISKIMDKRTAFIISDILSDNSARIGEFGENSWLDLPFEAGVKTGTSKNYCDNWTIGFVKDVTVGVWVGNPDNTGMFGVSGVSGAGPIWNDVMLMMAGRGYGNWMEVPSGVIKKKICVLSGENPGPYCDNLRDEYFFMENAGDTTCSWHPDADHVVLPPEYREWALKCGAISKDLEQASFLPGNGPPRIAFPQDHSKFMLDPARDCSKQMLRLRVFVPGRYEEVVWIVNGKEVPANSLALDWKPERGTHEVYCRVRSSGQWKETDRISFEVY